jgi:hypothetical protein
VEKGDILKTSVKWRMDLMNCLAIGDEVVIRDDTEFRRFIDSMITKGCDLGDTNKLLHVDFSKYSILGKIAVLKGCNSYFIREVEFMDEEKKVIYRISKGGCGFCDGSEIGSDNIVLVRPIPKDYKVEFIAPFPE